MAKRDVYQIVMRGRRKLWRALIDLSLGRRVVLVETTLKLAKSSAGLLRRRAKYYGIDISPSQIRAERRDRVGKTDAALWSRYSFYGGRS